MKQHISGREDVELYINGVKFLRVIPTGNLAVYRDRAQDFITKYVN